MKKMSRMAIIIIALIIGAIIGSLITFLILEQTLNEMEKFDCIVINEQTELVNLASEILFDLTGEEISNLTYYEHCEKYLGETINEPYGF